MGVFADPVKLKNWQNRFLPEDKRGEDIECEALVDSGAIQLALPADLVERLRLEQTGEVKAYTADGAGRTFRAFGIVDLWVQGRSCQVRAIELPYGARPLLGALPLEEMDWHIAPQAKKLVPNPQSPDGPLLPLC
jgi:clan AA aspartic protease